MALRAVERDHTLEGGREADEWADLDRFSARASRGVLRRMTEEEEAAGFSWEKYR